MVRASICVLLALVMGSTYDDDNDIEKLQAKKVRKECGWGVMQLGENFVCLMIFSERTFKSVLYIQAMHLIRLYISLGYKLH